MTHAARGTTTQLRHIPFIEEVAALGDDDPSGLAARAGLLVLRLVDAWMEDGALVGGVDARAAMSARAAVEAMPAGQLTRGVLMNIVDVVRDSHARDVQAIGPRLMAYGRGLDLDAQWQLAVDVYDTVIEHVHVDEDRESAINALLRKGSCLRDLGRLADADGCYDTAIPLALACADTRGFLRGRIGKAKLAATRGNLPQAEAILVDVLRLTNDASLTQVRSLALHDRSYIEHERGEYARAIGYAYAALQDSELDSERERILNDLATMFYNVGAIPVARDVYLILAVTAREQLQRWVSTINLMEVAAVAGSRAEFEYYRQQLKGSSLPPRLGAEFELHAARAYRLLGDVSLARESFERALSTANAHSMHQLAFEAEEGLLNRNVGHDRETPVPAYIMAGEIRQIADELRALRELSVSPSAQPGERH